MRETTRMPSTAEIYRRTETVEFARRGDDRTFEAVFSTDAPIDQGLGPLVLRHTPEAVNLERAKDGLPLLLDHDSRAVIGRATDFRVSDGKLRARVKFGESNLARQVEPDVISGVRKEVSIGFRIDELDREGGETLVALRWTPLEVSVVGVPADHDTGFGRSLTANPTRRTAMEQETITLPGGGGPPVDPPCDWMQTRQDEIDNILAAVEVHKRTGHDFSNLAARHIANGGGLKAFKEAVLKEFPEAPIISPFPAGVADRDGLWSGYETSPVLTDQSFLGVLRGYSVCRALHALIDPKAAGDAGLEFEVSREMERRTGQRSKGLMIPWPVLYTRAFTSANGGSSISTDLLAGEFIDALRNRSVVLSLGPRRLAGLQGDVSISKKTGTSSANWFGGDDDTEIAESEPTLGEVTLSPKFVGGLTTISRKLMVQGTPDAEGLVRDDLVDTVATGIDLAAIQGAGVGPEPRGILNTTGLTVNTYPNGQTPSWGNIVDQEGRVETANAAVATMAYVTTPTLKAKLKQTEKASGTAQFVWEPGREVGSGRMNGHRAEATGQMPAGKVLFGDWGSLIWGIWGGVDIDVNPWGAQDFKRGSVKVRVIATADFGVRHIQSFDLIEEAP